MTLHLPSSEHYRERILLVDVPGQTLGRLFREHGYAVSVATYDEALVALDHEDFHVVIMGTIEQRQQEVESIVELLRMSPTVPFTPICTYCSTVGPTMGRAMCRNGVDDFISSTASSDEILMRVENLIRLKATQSAQLRHARELQVMSDRLLTHRERLEDAAHARRDFIAMMVHDLNNPLGAILANATYLRDYDLPQEDASEMAQDIALAAQRMRNLVLNILDISRSEQDLLKPSVQLLPVADLITDVLASIEMQELTSQHDVHIQDEAAGIQMMADPDLMTRVFSNLLDNARKYTPRGAPIAIRIDTPDPTEVVVSIADAGEGISDEEKPVIFDVFTRSNHADVQTSLVSRGIGLAFCRSAVEAHGGRIWVEDNYPTGTIFSVSIPRGHT